MSAQRNLATLDRDICQPLGRILQEVFGGQEHLLLNTANDDKNIRLNSRDYTRTSGGSSAVQVKPNMTVTGTAGIYGIESSPRFAQGIAGDLICGVFSNPILKGAAGGNIGTIRCFEGKLESDSGSTRTVTNAVVLHAMQAMHGTVTSGPYVVKVDAAGGNVPWKALIDAPNEAGIANDTTKPSTTPAGHLVVRVNGNLRYVLLYSDTPA